MNSLKSSRDLLDNEGMHGVYSGLGSQESVSVQPSL